MNPPAPAWIASTFEEIDDREKGRHERLNKKLDRDFADIRDLQHRVVILETQRDERAAALQNQRDRIEKERLGRRAWWLLAVPQSILIVIFIVRWIATGHP